VVVDDSKLQAPTVNIQKRVNASCPIEIKPTINVVIDFEGGGRFLGEMTDCEPEKVAIGDEVEMTFRRLFTAGGVHNYFWKARPKR